MNIFVTDLDPRQSAQYLDDKRCVKMILESAQLLSTTMWELGYEGPYKATHRNHPSAIWARQTIKNYSWLVDHFIALCNEYTARYGKVHKCEQYAYLFREFTFKVPLGPLTPFPNCTTYKGLDDTLLAYKLYLNDKWDTDKRIPTRYRKPLR